MSDEKQYRWIPDEILQNLDLSWMEKCLWAEIHSRKDPFSVWELSRVMGVVPRTIANSLSKMRGLGIVEEDVRLAPEELMILVASKEGPLACEWCASKVYSLHGHHYPIPKKSGGIDTVAICGSCHADFHALENRNVARLEVV